MASRFESMSQYTFLYQRTGGFWTGFTGGLGTFNCIQQIKFQYLSSVYTYTCSQRQMWAYNWMKSTLSSWGIIKKNARIVVLGLDDSGKTVLIRRLDESIIENRPYRSSSYYQQTITIKNVTFTVIDINGSSLDRISNIDAVIYLVESSNIKRFQESRLQLKELMEKEELKNVPLAVLGNKIDKMDAVSQKQLAEALRIEPMNEWNKGFRPIKLFMCSIAKKKGYAQAFNWLATVIQ